jgi:hypothetical protein
VAGGNPGHFSTTTAGESKMKFRYKKIKIRMQQGASELEKIVPEWEVPIVQAVHPEVSEVSDVVVESAALSVSEEYQRLQNAYGAEREEGGLTGMAYIEAVYGQHGAGQQALKRAMQGAILPASAEVTPLEGSPALRQDLLLAIGDNNSDALDLIGDVSSVPDEEELAA